MSGDAQIYGKVSASGRAHLQRAAHAGRRRRLLVRRRGPVSRLAFRQSLGDLGENALDFTVGRTQYKLGHGMLLWDGASEGGSRGGYWTGARKAFEFAAIGRFKPGTHTFEAFYLDRDELPDADSDSKLWGCNYEYAFGEDTTLGATYMKWSADPAVAPQRDGLDVYNCAPSRRRSRASRGCPSKREYAQEDNGDALDSTAWNLLVAYQLDIDWKPKISYRYAF